MTTYPAPFPTAVAATLVWEGGYANDPVDPGGETNFGISKRSYPNLDIKHLTKDAAIAIYYKDFWLPGLCNLLPALIGPKVFDTSVNLGRFGAVKVLQLALNRLGVSVVVDGQIGPMTVAATKKAGEKALLSELRMGQANYYRNLVADHPMLAKFLKGWLRRAAS